MNFNSLKTALSKIEMPHDMQSRIIERCRNAEDDEDETHLQYSIKRRNIKKLYRAAFSACAAVAAVAAVTFVVVKTYPDSNIIITDSSSFTETSMMSAPTESSDFFVSSQTVSATSAPETPSSSQNSNTVTIPSETILQSSQLSAMSQADTENTRTVTTVHPGEMLTVLNNILRPDNAPVVSSLSPGAIGSMSSAARPDYSAPDISSSASSQPNASTSSDDYFFGSVSSEGDTSEPIVNTPPPAMDAPTYSAPAADMPSVAIKPEWVPEDKFLTKINTYEQFEGVMAQDYYYEPIHSSGAYYPEFDESLSTHEYLERATDFYADRTYYKLPYDLDDVNITEKGIQFDYDFFGSSIYFSYSLDPKFNDNIYGKQVGEIGEKITHSKQNGDTVIDYTIHHYTSPYKNSSHRYSIYFECDSIAFNIVVFLNGDVDENTYIKLLDYLPVQKVTF